MRWIYRLHRITGFISAPFMLILCLTGLILLYEEEITEWSTGEARVHGTPTTAAALCQLLPEGVEKAQAAAKGQTIRSIRFAPSIGRMRFRFQKPQEGGTSQRMGRGKAVDLLLTDGVLQQITSGGEGRTSLHETMRTIKRFHVRLNDGEAGLIILIAACVMGMIAVVTGFILYPPFMKKMSFGERRQFSLRLWFVDWHKIWGILGGSWLFILCLSVPIIYGFSAAKDRYSHAAWETAQQHFRAAIEGGVIPVHEAAARVMEGFPDRNITAIEFPTAAHPFYAFELAEASSQSGIYAFPQLVFIGADGAGDLLSPPYTEWLAWGTLGINLHLRNHNTAWLKGMWAFFLVASLLMTLTGLGAYIARFPKHAKQAPTIYPIIPLGAVATWVVAAAPILGLFLPLWGASGLGAVFFGITICGALCLWDKSWFIKQ